MTEMNKAIDWEKLDIFKDDDEFEGNELTEAGIIDLSKLATSNKFNFWIGHTNFKITQRDLSILDGMIDGVESLAIISPYRFIVSVGKMFNEDKIKKIINKHLCQVPFKFDDKLNQEIKELKEVLSVHFSDWMIYVLPNGCMEYVGLNDNETEFETISMLFRNCENQYGGLILTPKMMI